MAGIDKTWFRKWDQYKEVHDWADSVGRVTDEYGNTFRPIDFMCDWTVESYHKAYIEQIKYFKKKSDVSDPEKYIEFILWNTPTYFDVWLIRNCPIKFIQERLMEQYGSEYEDIKNHKSIYDSPRADAGHKFKVKKIYDIKYRDDDSRWSIQIHSEPEGMMYCYNESTNMWYDFCECREITSNIGILKGHIDKRKLARIIKHWALPAGVTLSFTQVKNGYVMKKFLVKIV